MSSAASPRAIAEAWMDAAARCDIDAIEAGMADTCLRYGEPDWIVVKKDHYIAAYRQFLKSFSDYRLDILNVVESGRTVIFELVERATLTGPYPLPDGRIVRPNGQSYTDRACTWLDIDDNGKIAEIRAYIPSTRDRLMACAMAESA